MTISKDLFLAILAMDSYNRGYGAGIADGKGTKDENGNDIDGLGEAGSIGNAAINFTLADISRNFAAEAQANGFYAIAYTIKKGAWEGLGEDTTVIAYRGSNDKSKDVLNGYGIGAGEPNGPQAKRAIDFYKAVVAQKVSAEEKETISPDDLTADQLMNSGVIITGHSLGAGLGGGLAA